MVESENTIPRSSTDGFPRQDSSSPRDICADNIGVYIIRYYQISVSVIFVFVIVLPFLAIESLYYTVSPSHLALPIVVISFEVRTICGI